MRSISYVLSIEKKRWGEKRDVGEDRRRKWHLRGTHARETREIDPLDCRSRSVVQRGRVPSKVGVTRGCAPDTTTRFSVDRKTFGGKTRTFQSIKNCRCLFRTRPTHRLALLFLDVRKENYKNPRPYLRLQGEQYNANPGVALCGPINRASHTTQSCCKPVL